MNKFIVVTVFLFMLSGCLQQGSSTQKSGSAVSTQEAQQIGPSTAILSSKAAEREQVNAQQREAVSPSEGAEETIAQNKWGFAVYDPETGIEKFYTSNGSFLGDRKR